MPLLPGAWGEPSISGPVRLVVGDREFWIPEDASVRWVHGGRVSFAWIALPDRRVLVLSPLGELIESGTDAKKRMTHWLRMPPEEDRRRKS